MVTGAGIHTRSSVESLRSLNPHFMDGEAVAQRGQTLSRVTQRVSKRAQILT